MPTLNFPDHFLWGAATSSHQVEGGTCNDWSEWEKQNALRLAKEAPNRFGHLRHWNSIQAEAQQPENYISGSACEHYQRFREDFDLAHSLGHNAHRFSLEWSRIEPAEGKFDDAAIEHYREVLLALHERQLEPFVTLWHWTLPLWLKERGGAESAAFPEYFERYVRYVFSRLRGLATYWITINEPTSIIGAAYLRDNWPPQRNSLWAALKVYRRLAKAHRKAFHALHELSPTVQVGFANMLHSFETYRRNSWLDELGIGVAKLFTNRLMLYLTRGHHDFLTIQYYFHDRIKFVRPVHPTDALRNDLGWEIYPKGIYNIISYLRTYHLPIYITENGLADAADSRRGKFIRDHLTWVHRAIEEGADVRGYFHWSLLDNFEWDKGYWPRFGLVHVDCATQKRTVRPSAQLYAEIIRANALSIPDSET